MDDQARRFQEAALLHNQGRSGRGIRYSEGLHKEAVAYTRRRQEQGHRLTDIARDLGIKPVTLARWLKKSQGTSLRPVEIVASPRPAEISPAATGATMILPNGIRIEGLGLESLASLLRQIG